MPRIPRGAPWPSSWFDGNSTDVKVLEFQRIREEFVDALRSEYARGRREVNELFILAVECELGSGCLHDRTCSGASHWQTAGEIRDRALEEAIVVIDALAVTEQGRDAIKRAITEIRALKRGEGTR